MNAPHVGPVRDSARSVAGEAQRPCVIWRRDVEKRGPGSGSSKQDERRPGSDGCRTSGARGILARSGDRVASTARPPEALRQEFPADEATRALFDAQNIPVSKANVWAVEIDPSANIFAYELKRPERFLRVEFDTTRPVAAPPAPWGWPPQD